MELDKLHAISPTSSKRSTVSPRTKNTKTNINASVTSNTTLLIPDNAKVETVSQNEGAENLDLKTLQQLCGETFSAEIYNGNPKTLYPNLN